MLKNLKRWGHWHQRKSVLNKELWKKIKEYGWESVNPHIAGDRKTLCELYEIELLNEGQNNKRLYVDNCTING